MVLVSLTNQTSNPTRQVASTARRTMVMESQIHALAYEFTNQSIINTPSSHSGQNDRRSFFDNVIISNIQYLSTMLFWDDNIPSLSLA